MLERFNDIIKSNINAIMDKFEDPAKMVDQYLIDLTEDLAEVKKETASVMAEEKRCAKALEENAKQVEKYTNLAKAALQAGNEGDARILLAKKNEYAAQQENLQTALNAAKANSEKMKQLHNKLVSDIESLKTRKEAIKNTVSVAKTQEKVNKYTETADKMTGKMGAFNRMEEKANKRLAEATAMAELNATGDPAQSLEEKYSGSKTDAAMDAEIAALRAEMGLQ